MKNVFMKPSQAIGLLPTAMIAVLLLAASNTKSIAALPGDNSTNGLNPVASFEFRNRAHLGEDSVSLGRKSVVVGEVKPVDSPFGCAAEFDGKGRISVSGDHLLDFTRTFSATAWVNGSGAQFRTLEWEGMRSPNFQVVGDRIYFVTNSDSPRDNPDPPAHGEALYSPSAIWSGVADVSLGSRDVRKRTRLPLSGLEPKLQVVGDKIFFEYFGGDARGNWQIYTGTSGIDGSDWLVKQRTLQENGYASEQSRNLQVVGNKIYYAFPLKGKNGKWQLWTATSNIDGSSWKALQQTTTGGLIPSFHVSGDKIYYIYLSGSLSGVEKSVDVVISYANLDGSGWHEIRRVHGAGPSIIAQLTVNKDTIYYTFSKPDSKGNAHLWTGKISKDGSSPQERQRTFGAGNVEPAGVQVVGDKVMYAFSATKQPWGGVDVQNWSEMAFWTASTDLDGGHWIEQREIGGDGNNYISGYKILEVVGGKNYYDMTRSYHVGNKGDIVLYENTILAYSGSNILNKGDSYGIGMSAAGSVSGFVNAGEDYLYRGEAPEDIAGAMAEQKVAAGWHHVAVTYDGNILRLYVDGRLARETRYGRKPATNPFPLSIGDGFVGKIAHLKLFDRALDRSEISTLADRHGQTSCGSAPQ
jgi:hypothetical protein